MARLPPLPSKKKPKAEPVEDPENAPKAQLYGPQYSTPRLAIKVYQALIGVGRMQAAKEYRKELRQWCRARPGPIDRDGIKALAKRFEVNIF